MTISEYLNRHKGKCLKANSFEQADANYLVTWRIPPRVSKRQGRPVIREQRVWGYETLKEAEATAKKIKGWGGSHIRIHTVKHSKGKR